MPRAGQKRTAASQANAGKVKRSKVSKDKSYTPSTTKDGQTTTVVVTRRQTRLSARLAKVSQSGNTDTNAIINVSDAVIDNTSPHDFKGVETEALSLAPALAESPKEDEVQVETVDKHGAPGKSQEDSKDTVPHEEAPTSAKKGTRRKQGVQKARLTKARLAKQRKAKTGPSSPGTVPDGNGGGDDESAPTDTVNAISAVAEQQQEETSPTEPDQKANASISEEDTNPENATSPAEEKPASQTSTEDSSQKTKKQKAPKQNNKGYTPGVTPYPDYEGPSHEECEVVYKLLAEEHKDKEDMYVQKEAVPRASLEMAGCGEVKKVIDALLRTVLSGSTSMQNANAALQGLIKKFGVAFEGSEEESVNWFAVHSASRKDLEKAIWNGGLAPKKSKTIKDILEQVYQQGLERAKAGMLAEGTAGQDSQGIDTSQTTATDDSLPESDAAMTKVLSLEHLRSAEKTEAIRELIKFDGVGVKTAACVSLFCLRKESFAVDTHVHRFCRWLKWVPDNATAEKTFNHCELRVPEHLKYGLHQLFIIHGQRCYRCRASTRDGTREWRDCRCPLEHLLDRGEEKRSADKGQKTLDMFVKKREQQVEKGEVKEEEGVEGEEDNSQLTQAVDEVAEVVLNPILNAEGKVQDKDEKDDNGESEDA